MSFFNECSYILRKSDKDMIVLNNYNGIVSDYFRDSESLISSDIIKDSSIDFTNYYFDIDFQDNIYGIFNDKDINIVEFDNLVNKFNYSSKIEYDYKNFNIDFPYIHILKNDIHIIYYLTSKSSPTTVLFHHHRHNNKWIENKIDFINMPFLDNFIVFFNQNMPIIFYFKDHDGFPQVFTSSFNLLSYSWSTPLQITNSHTSKIYLSVVKDSLNFYHISFSESNNNAYSIKYINGYLNSDSFTINLSKYINNPCECLFPTLIKNKSILYLMWVENKFLYTSTSDNLGLSWSKFEIDEFSTKNKFGRTCFKSNYIEDSEYICNTLFISKENISILGF